MLDRHPAAYLRRSYVDVNSPGDISLGAQRAAVRRLAEADGHNGDLREYNDWGVSADVAKAAKRTAYSDLLADMEAGRVSAVYAFDVDRLYRDVRDLIRLQDAARAHGVRIVTTAGPLPIGDDADPAAEGFAFIGAVFGRMELQKAKKRNRAAFAQRKARGDKLGQPHFGYRLVKADGRYVEERDPSIDLEPIRQAYVKAGTILGATRLLNAQGVPSPKGATWHTFGVTRTIERNWPELLPKRSAVSGGRIRGSAILAQLVRCPYCDGTLTPNKARKQLYCPKGHVNRATHPRYVAREADIVPFVRLEMARLQKPDAVLTASEVDARRAAIADRIRDIQRKYLRGGIDDDLFDEEKARAQRELDELASPDLLAEVPTDIDWSWDAASLNGILRAVFKWVELDESMKPIRAEWIRPEWRRAS